MPFTTGVYNLEPISYKHPYTLFVPPITPLSTSSRYANRKYCLFKINLTFASNDYAWEVMIYLTCLLINNNTQILFYTYILLNSSSV